MKRKFKSNLIKIYFRKTKAKKMSLNGKNIIVAIIGTTITFKFELMKSPDASIIDVPILISGQRHPIIIMYIRVPTPIATAAAMLPL
jgi:hypothetical protein